MLATCFEAEQHLNSLTTYLVALIHVFTHVTHMHTLSPTSSYTLQMNKEVVKKKEEVILIWRDHYTAAVLQCLVNYQ